MYTRALMASAVALFLATPAFAGCQEEITMLNDAVLAAETGAAGGATDMPETKHQQQALSGEQKDTKTAEPGAATSSVRALSPHQRQAVREIPDEGRDQASSLLSEARKMADTGDEQGCMGKVDEARRLLGIED